MDITLLFKACVKTVRTRNKAFGVAGGDGDKNRILGPHIKRSGFALKAKDVVNNITRLRDFLLEHRRAYLNFAGYLSDIPQLTDSERDKIDAGAQRIMNTCSHLIHELKKESVSLDKPSQLNEHQQNVCDLAEHYLKSVCKVYSEQRAIRVKRTVDMQKMSRLEIDGSPSKTTQAARKRVLESNEMSHGEETSQWKVPYLEVSEESSFAIDETEQLSAEELQMFEQENEQLFNELNSLSDEVRQIESKVVQVAELQEIFTEKVLQQDMDIDRIASTVVGATENVKDGNEQIRQAIQRNAGLRVFILFFLLVMSFSLLFLDWYND